MTFLLFVVSLAIVEYLVRDVRTPTNRLDANELASLKRGGNLDQTAASDLLALNQALASPDCTQIGDLAQKKSGADLSVDTHTIPL